MSGTSCDGLDLALCSFTGAENKWDFEILACETVDYESDLKTSLSGAHLLSGEDLMALDMLYGRFIGTALNKFHSKTGIVPQIVASHGHTVYHRPVSGKYSLQIGNGAAIAALSGVTTICDFRNLDIALGGEGAPLVPCGDMLLFPQYSYCLNLGGIANISFEQDQNRVAFDICPANMALNYLANSKGVLFDPDGSMAKHGKVDSELLSVLEKLEFYHQTGPRSLGREWFEAIFLPELNAYDISVEDKLATVCEHIAERIFDTVERTGTMLCTGGGTHNTYLLNRISHKLGEKGIETVIPADDLINFKEALIFAFLGVLRSIGRTNTFASVTGASRDSSGGCVYAGPSF